ncbi:hypothetical protein RKD18_008088 [Streptomyces phaeoluteigriseus]
MGGRVEFVAGKAVLGTDGCRVGGGIDDGGVVAVSAVVQGTAGAGSEKALQCVLGGVGYVADGVQAVLGERHGCLGPDAGQLPDRAGAQKRVDRLG